MKNENSLALEKIQLARRRLIVFAGSLGASSALIGSQSCSRASQAVIEDIGNPDCALTPKQVEGPFYTDTDLIRRNITDQKPGLPFTFNIAVTDVNSCMPIPNARVDIWHADAEGLYSAYPGQGDSRDIDTSGERFLRGNQITDNSGLVSFDSIYPGWYPGRAPHAHIKVILDELLVVTTQLYFPDAISKTVYGDPAYAGRGTADTSNKSDGFGATNNGLRVKGKPV